MEPSVAQLQNNAQPILEVSGVSKRFPGVLALDKVKLRLYPAEILAVIGENGAGKSTLMKILGGIISPDTGKILLDGKEAALDSPATATKAGMALIHQELNLAENLTVAENVFLGREFRRGGMLGLTDQGKIYRETGKILRRLAAPFSEKTMVGQLSIGQRQMVEIARALVINSRILILDEPTSSLSRQETMRLFEVLRELRVGGVSIIYVSHRLGEVEEIADRVMVLRDGCNTGELQAGEIDRKQMIKLMVGRDIQQFYHHTNHTSERVVLEVEGLVTRQRLHQQLNFNVRAGEIVGLAGLVGSGRTQLARALFGIDKPVAGTIRIAGKMVKIDCPQDAVAAGMALVPEDRKLQGLVLEMAVGENIVLAAIRQYQILKMIRRRRKRDAANQMIERLHIRTPSPDQQTQYLSGGNQQKVVLSKWLCLKPLVLILDEPTRGVDVLAKEEIYRLMEELTSDGIGVLMISSEMQEVLAVADRVLVMHEGQIAGELTGNQLTEESIMSLATGNRA